jgi:hypothetical protein
MKIAVSGNFTTLLESHVPVAGSVGLRVEFCLDEAWDGLEKIAVFRAIGKTIDVLCPENTAVIPWELLQTPGCRLWAGIYGSNENGSVQIPTVWTDLGVIAPGADPSGDESADPTLPVWQQLQQDVEKSLKTIIEMENKMISGQYMPVT